MKQKYIEHIFYLMFNDSVQFLFVRDRVVQLIKSLPRILRGMHNRSEYLEFEFRGVRSSWTCFASGEY